MSWFWLQTISDPTKLLSQDLNLDPIFHDVPVSISHMREMYNKSLRFIQIYMPFAPRINSKFILQQLHV